MTALRLLACQTAVLKMRLRPSSKLCQRAGVVECMLKWWPIQTGTHRGVILSDSLCRTICRAEWQQYQGSCYRSVEMKTAVTWHKAETTCNNYGGHLPVISSAEENNFVSNMFTSSCSLAYRGYLGVHDVNDEAHFSWVDDSTSSYTNWKSGEPNNAGTPDVEEDCGQMYLNGEELSKWNDIPCTEKYESCFLCEDSK